jgi:hypothetical protein
MHDYLQLMAIPTDIAAGDSWNPVLHLCADVADLEVVGLGRLECRPLQEQQSACPIPPEVWGDRIGYVVVRISDSLQEATVLGFTPTAVEAEFLSLDQLQPIDTLLSHLHDLLHPAPTSVVNLSQWFQGVLATGWQMLEDVLPPSETGLAFNFRSADVLIASELPRSDTVIRRAKRLSLSTPAGDGVAELPCAIVLILEVQASEMRSSWIRIQVRPADVQPYLPPHLRLTVLDESGTGFLETVSRQADYFLQLQFNGQVGERFSLQVRLGDTQVTEDFVI